jgi:alkylated DNA repair dioxygenase AlkB
MESFFNTVVDDVKLRLPNGEVLEDTAILPNFTRDFLGVDIDELWKRMLCYGNHPIDEPIEKNGDIRWVTGDHPGLKYRGNAVKRNKIWAQKNYDNGLSRYGYTGWQYQVTSAMVKIEDLPINEMVEKINEKLELGKVHNNWIVTQYKSGADNIGFHSDKMKDFEENSCFIVIKCGEPRKFEFSWDEPSVQEAKEGLKRAVKLKEKDIIKMAKLKLKIAIKNRMYPEIFYSKTLEAGTAVIVGTNANARVKHGVPPIEKKDHLSGSIVGRSIKTVMSWENIERKINGKKRKLSD